MRRGIVWAAVAMLAMSSAAACQTARESATNTAPPAKAGVNNIAATPRDKVAQGGRFVWAINQVPTNFNIAHIDGTLQANAHIMRALMPAFFVIDAAGNARWNEDYLAAEPKIETDPRQVITFAMNPKATWSDGTPLTWEDLLWQWKANNGTNQAYRIASSNGWKDIESITKGKDDREAIVTFRNKYAEWQPMFNTVYPQSTNRDPKIFNEGWVNKIPASAGPFKLDSLDKAAQTVTLVPSETWWGNKPKLDRIIFRVVDETAMADALANGEIDFMDIGANVNNYKRALQLGDKVDLRRAAGPNFRHITLNGSRPQLADKAVRQAISAAINRDTIGRAMLQPLDMQAQPLNNHIFMTNHAAYTDNAGAVGTYSPDKAKTALDAAGWKLDGTVRKKNGQPLNLNLVIPAQAQASQQESELIQAMLKAIGVTVNIKLVPGADFFDKFITPGDFDMTIFSWNGSAFPVSSNEAIYKKPVKNAKGELQIEENYARIGDDRIDSLFKQATAELDKTRQQALGNQIDALLWDHAGVLPMYQRPDLAAVKKDVVNVGAFAYASVVYEDIGYKN